MSAPKEGQAGWIMPSEQWAMAWVEPNDDHFIVGHMTGSTRSGVWDKILPMWFNLVESGGKQLYFPHADSPARRNMLVRHSAIKALRHKGIRVIRVRVVQA